MKTTKDIKRFQQNLQAEREAITLYEHLASLEQNPDLAAVYHRLAATEQKHADFWAEKLREAGVDASKFQPGWRTRLFRRLATTMGSAFVLPALASLEKTAASGYNGQADAEAVRMPAEERSHARIFGHLAQTTTQGLQGTELARFEGRHRAGSGNALRAAVLGANDGLISVFSLVMGVAGANVPAKTILLTGFAGLLAGALSMALGEWLSVQSSRELYLHQIEIEERELTELPEEEQAELALIYQAKGMDAETARMMADRLIHNPTTALDTLAREELGINPDDLGGSAWEAAITSFILFSVGALIPVIPYIFFAGTTGIMVSAVVSGLGLFIIGALITLMTGRNPVLSGLRQVVFGLAAAAVTFGIGWIIGVNLAG